MLNVGIMEESLETLEERKLMFAVSDKQNIKRRSINLTIREDVVKEVKALKLNASKAAEAGLIEAIKTVKEKEWLEENREAIKAYNERITKNGTLLKPYWLKEE